MSACANQRQIIFVWDLDETLILFNSLQIGSFPTSATLGSLEDIACRNLGGNLADVIVDFCDDHLYFKQLDRMDPVQLEDLCPPEYLLANANASASSSSKDDDLKDDREDKTACNAQPSERSASPAPKRMKTHNIADEVASWVNTIARRYSTGLRPLAVHTAKAPDCDRASLERACTMVPFADPSVCRGSSTVQATHQSPPTQSSSCPPLGSNTTALQDGKTEAAALIASPNSPGLGSGSTADPVTEGETMCLPSAAASASTEVAAAAAPAAAAVTQVEGAAVAASPAAHQAPMLQGCSTPPDLARLLQQLDAVDCGTRKAAIQLLETLKTYPGYTIKHTLVTSGHLVATFGKLLLFGLDHLFPQDHVFSASGVTKLECFLRVKDQFGIVGQTNQNPAFTSSRHHQPDQQQQQHLNQNEQQQEEETMQHKINQQHHQQPKLSSPHADPLSHHQTASNPAQASRQCQAETLFLAIGDGKEEAGAAALMGWPFLHINLPTVPTPPYTLQGALPLPDDSAAGIRGPHIHNVSTTDTPKTLIPGTTVAGPVDVCAEQTPHTASCSPSTIVQSAKPAASLSASLDHHGGTSSSETTDVGNASDLTAGHPCGKGKNAAGAVVVGAALHLLTPGDVIRLALQGVGYSSSSSRKSLARCTNTMQSPTPSVHVGFPKAERNVFASQPTHPVVTKQRSLLSQSLLSVEAGRDARRCSRKLELATEELSESEDSAHDVEEDDIPCCNGALQIPKRSIQKSQSRRMELQRVEVYQYQVEEMYYYVDLYLQKGNEKSKPQVPAPKKPGF